MPEIKNQFAGGKMNKDVDERLVPKGEYRHAVNIQVTTSEGSDVGTVQNILGNSLAITPGLPINNALSLFNNHICVGSISNEAKNELYWMLAEYTWKDQITQSGNVLLEQVVHTNSSPLLNVIATNFQNYNSFNWIVESKSAIVKYKNNNAELVFVDKASVTINAWDANVGSTDGGQFEVLAGDVAPSSSFTPTISSGFSSFGTGYGYNNSTIFQLEVGDVTNITAGMDVVGVGLNPHTNEIMNFWPNTSVLSVEQVGTWTDINGDQRIQGIVQLNNTTGGFGCIAEDNTYTYVPNLVNPPNCPSAWINIQMIVTHWVFESKTLQLDRKNLITGINIIDDLLFWTDNYSEPKCINITDSIKGTDQTGNFHTDIFVEERDILVPAREKHVTVIKNAPKNPPIINSKQGRDGNSYGIAYQVPTANAGVGDTLTIDITSPFATELNYQVGDVLAFKLLSSYLSTNITSFFPISTNSNYTLSGSIVSIGSSSASGMTSVSIIVQQFVGNSLGSDYAVDLLDNSKVLYKLKFPRFATRYKYKDGQYSSFSPFSDVAFVPSNYEYNARTGFNIGMENSITSVSLKDIITLDIPEDVVDIDILYKESDSPNVYLLETITNLPQKLPVPADTSIWNPKKLDDNYEYIITSENINALISSEQILRSYDNVPRAALGQDIVGSRLVYGNYLQNYNIEKENILISTSISPYPNNERFKSIKSIRDYEVGLVFSDKYGRETPVITSEQNKVTLSKANADKNNRFKVSWKTTDGYQLPDWVESYKFYVKETSTEYYNLSMDRFYDAEDSNIWLSFPSSERNKVDIDTYLILKKEQNSSNLVLADYRYKILDIKNEAPNFIKVDKKDLAKIVEGPVTNGNNGGSGLPVTTNPLFVDNTTNAYPDSVLVNGLPGTKQLHVKGDVTPTGVNRIGGSVGRLRPSSLISDEYEVEVRINTFKSNFVQGNYVTSWRKINKITHYGKNGVTLDTLPTSSSAQQQDFTIHLSEAWENDSSFFFTDQIGTVTTEGTNGAPVLEFRKLIRRDNLAEFAGRFFVKILKDISFYEQVLSQMGSQTLVPKLQQDLGYVKDFTQEDFSGQGNISSNFSTTVSSQISALPHSWASARYPSGVSGVPIPTDAYYHPSAWSYIHNKLNASSAKGFFIDEAFATGISPFYNFREAFQTRFVDDSETRERNQVALFGGWNSASSPQPTLDYYSNVDTNLSSLYAYHTSLSSDQLTDYTGCQTVSGVTNSIPSNLTNPCPDRIAACVWEPLLNNTSLSQNKYYHEGNGAGASPANVLDISIIGGIGNEWKPSQGGLGFTPHDPNGFGYLTWNDAQLALTSLDDAQRDIMFELCTIGNKFRFDNDPTEEVFTILDFRIQSKKNYSEGFYDDTYPGVTQADPNFSSNYPHDGSTPISDSVNYTANANHRHTISILLDKDIGASGYTPTDGSIGNVPGYAGNWNTPTITGDFAKIVFLEARTVFDGFGVDSSLNPSIWETEPKQNDGLDIYYEASRSYPFSISKNNALLKMPIGSLIRPDDPSVLIQPGTTVVDWQERQISNSIVLVTNKPLTFANEDIIRFTLDDGSESQAEFWQSAASATFPNGPTNPLNTTGTADYFQYYVRPFKLGLLNGLSWSNCFSFNNGVESNSIRDDFNSVSIDNGAIASATILEPYEEERRKSGLIFSGLYNSNSGVNNLNQFIAAEKITKDLNPTYGSIQKLHARDSDLIALCEDKVIKILANKDALFNADGSPQLTANERVLGQSIPFVGEFGISTNPESFASESYRVYFTDKVRGKVIRLSMDGLTPISAHGMKDYFKDNLKSNDKIIGSYDDKKDEYNVTLPNTGTTVSFSESVRGWVSFKSFVPENAISCANDYYTLKNGVIWKHHVETIPETRNNFYGAHTENDYSSLEVILNDAPSVVKSYQTINYEGSQSKVDQFVSNTNPSTGVTLSDNQYYNLTLKKGWYVNNIITDKEKGSVNEFIEKEGKWFNYIKGKNVQLSVGNQIHINNDGSSSFDQASFSIQGLGVYDGPVAVPVPGCTDNTFANYNPNATIDDGSCFNPPPPPPNPIHGCTDVLATNYNSNANTDDGSCFYNGAAVIGCMEPTASNYNAFVNVSNNSCIWLGCTDNSALNTTDFTAAYAYAAANNIPVAISDDGSCIPVVLGCTDPTAFNYDNTATVDNNNCIPVITGCMDPTASNYVIPAGNSSDINTSDQSACVFDGCTDDTPGINPDINGNIPPSGLNISGYLATNFDPAANNDDGSCAYSVGCTDDTQANYNPSAQINDPSNCIACDWVQGGVYPYNGNPVAITNINESTPNTNDGQVAVEVNVNFPNPTAQGQTYTPFTIELLNSSGSVAVYTFTPNSGLYNAVNSNSILFSHLAPGVYTVQVLSGPNQYGVSGICEYNENVTVLVGSPILTQGCMDPNACDYNPQANDPTPCNYATCAGCIDNAFPADNYGSQTGTGGVGQMGTPCSVLINGNISNLCTIQCGNGFNATPQGNGCCAYTILGCTDGSTDANGNNVMFNYNPVATVDDGSCILAVYGCMDSTAINFDSTALYDDGSCIPAVVGCMDSTALNYDPTANVDTIPTSCCYISGCTDSTYPNYNPNACQDDGSCAHVFGCMTPTACNFDCSTALNSGSTTPCTDGVSMDDNSCVFGGCTDPLSCFFDQALANTFPCTDDDQCIYLGVPNPNVGFNAVPNNAGIAGCACEEPSPCDQAAGIGIPTTYATEIDCLNAVAQNSDCIGSANSQ